MRNQAPLTAQGWTPLFQLTLRRKLYIRLVTKEKKDSLGHCGGEVQNVWGRENTQEKFWGTHPPEIFWILPKELSGLLSQGFWYRKKSQEDVNGEKLTVKKYGGFWCRFLHGLRRVFHGL